LKEIENLMRSLEWSGVANIDLIYDTNNDVFKILEINPRFWATLDASLTAGVNFPYLYCLASLGEKIEDIKYNFLEYLSFKGLVKALRADKRLIFNFYFIFNNTQLRFVLNDHKLNIYRIYIRIKFLLKPITKKVRFFRTGL